ncbi:MAG: hypothetical protein ACREQ9_04010 [Candidatus Binatia bacterium]
MEPRLRAAFALIERLTLEPERFAPADVERARTSGLRDEAVVDAIFVCAGFNLIDRVADALDFFVPPDFRRGAPIVQKLGYWWMSATWPSEAGVPRSGRERKEALFRRLEDAILRAPGALEAGTRAGIAEEREVPEPLRPYVAKVFRHAYKVTDEDVAALRAEGFSEDQIFEVTLAAAFGAAAKRLRNGLGAVADGARPSQPAVEERFTSSSRSHAHRVPASARSTSS